MADFVTDFVADCVTDFFFFLSFKLVVKSFGGTYALSLDIPWTIIKFTVIIMNTAREQ